MQKETLKPTLPFYERFLALGVACFFIFIALFNYILDEGELPVHTGAPYFLKNPLIEVMVEGKVKRPGMYQVEKGKEVVDVIRLAEPLDGANLKRIKLDSKITRRRKIVVP